MSGIAEIKRLISLIKAEICCSAVNNAAGIFGSLKAGMLGGNPAGIAGMLGNVGAGITTSMSTLDPVRLTLKLIKLQMLKQIPACRQWNR